MKRSQMVAILAGWVSENVKYYYRNGVNFSEDDASALLDKIEALGMLPPYDAAVDDEAWGHEWEQEDE